MSELKTLRLKSKDVRGVRWQTGVTFPGTRIEELSLKIRHSDDRRYAYLEKDDLRPDSWMECALEEREITEEEKKAHLLQPATALFKPKTGPMAGKTYVRKVLAFNFWKVRAYSHYEADVTTDDEFVRDYVALMGWTEAQVSGPARAGRVILVNGHRFIVREGDWLVQEGDVVRCVPAAEAEEKFEVVP